MGLGTGERLRRGGFRRRHGEVTRYLHAAFAEQRPGGIQCRVVDLTLVAMRPPVDFVDVNLTQDGFHGRYGNRSCRNCAQGLVDGQKYCADCGQRTDVERLTMREIGHDLLHALTHADHSILALMRALLTQPGWVARDFVAGRRKKHFGPFVFLVITTGLATALMLGLHLNWFAPLQQAQASQLLHRNMNVVILIQVPILAAFCALLFRRERLHYAEHLVLAAYAAGFRMLVLAFVAIPVWYVLHFYVRPAVLVWAYYALWLGYFAWAASQFYAGNRPVNALKGVVASLATQASAFVIVWLFSWSYQRVFEG
jgi:hypothetical protein